MLNRSRQQYLQVSDEDLVASVAETRSSEAFATLYDRHSRAAYSLAYRMMGEKQASEDLLQDAFLQLWRAAGTYRPERGSLRTWILAVVHNRGIDQLRAAGSRRRTQERAAAANPASQSAEAFSQTWQNSQRDRVREALNQLPAEQVKVLELAYFSGYTHKEIAELLDLPLGTVKGRMRLGLKKIKEFFEDRGMAVPS